MRFRQDGGAVGWRMAGDFEYEHPMLLHLLLIGVAVSTYLVYPDDIVWALVRQQSNSRLLERIVFGAGTVLLLASAVLETFAKNYYLFGGARLLLALVLGLLLPWPGTLILVAGEAILMLRLLRRDQASQSSNLQTNGRSGFRRAISKWGLTASLFLFTWTLQDRVAEIGAGASLLLWFALNARRQVHSDGWKNIT